MGKKKEEDFRVLPEDGSPPGEGVPIFNEGEDEEEESDDFSFDEREEEKALLLEVKEGSNGNGNGKTGRDHSVIPSLQTVVPEQSEGASVLEDYNPLQELFRPGDGPRGIDTRSEVNEIQIIQMARARAVAKHFGIALLDEFVNDILRLSLSKNRKSRKEFVQSFQSAMSEPAEGGSGIIQGMMDKLR